MSTLALIAMAVAVALSAIMRLIQSGQLRKRVEFGMAGLRELAELTGIVDMKELQDRFGPPGLDRVWSQVTLGQIRDKRLLSGALMSDARLHWASFAIAALALGWHHPLLQFSLLFAALIQAGAWTSATRIPK